MPAISALRSARMPVTAPGKFSALTRPAPVRANLPQKLGKSGGPGRGTGLFCVSAKQTVECDGSLETFDLVCDEIGSQQIAHGAVRPDNSQRNSLADQFAM